MQISALYYTLFHLNLWNRRGEWPSLFFSRFWKKGSVVQLETHSSSPRQRGRSVGHSPSSVTHVCCISRFASNHDNAPTLTPCSRVLLEKLTCSHLVKKFHAFYVTWRFITALTSACPYSEPDQSSPCPRPTSWRSILTLTCLLQVVSFRHIYLP